MRRSISCDQFVEGPVSSLFLGNLLREQGITDVNFVSDNAKPRATLPMNVFLQSSNDKSTSRWDSIPRVESLDALDTYSRSRRRTTSTYSGLRKSYSLSPSGMLQRRKSLQSEDFEKSISSLKQDNQKNQSSTLPTVLRNNLLELVGTDGAFKTPEEKLNHAASLVTDSNPPLRMPQRRAFIDPHQHSGQSKPRRAGRRPVKSASTSSTHHFLIGHDNELAKDGNGTVSTQELTPSPNNPVEAAAKILKLANNPIQAPPLNTPPSLSRKTLRSRSTGSLLRTSKAKKSQRAKSPPHQLPATPPALRRGQRKSMVSTRPKSPPPQRPGTPPALKRPVRTRRHSDSIINIDMEVSQKLLHLAQISSPVQPVRRRSYDSDDLEVYEQSGPEQDEEERSAMTKARKYISHEDSDTASIDKTKSKRSGKESKSDQTSPRPKVHFSSQVKFSPSRSKKNTGPRVCFSPRRQHSAPLTGFVARRDNEDESALLASFQRTKPFSPGSAFTKTAVVTSKTGATTRTRKNSARRSNNRDIVKASFRAHGSDGDDYLDYNIGHSSMGSLEMSSMVDFLATPSLETPPSKRRGKKKKSRRTSMPPDMPQLPSGTSEQKTKKKRSKRRSVG